VQLQRLDNKKILKNEQGHPLFLLCIYSYNSCGVILASFYHYWDRQKKKHESKEPYAIHIYCRAPIIWWVAILSYPILRGASERVSSSRQHISRTQDTHFNINWDIVVYLGNLGLVYAVQPFWHCLLSSLELFQIVWPSSRNHSQLGKFSTPR